MIIVIELSEEEYKDLRSILNRSYSYSDTHINNDGDHLFEGDSLNKLEKIRSRFK